MQIDEKFTFYANIIQEMGQSITYKDVECLRINVKPILASIREHALQWKTVLGEKLSKKTKENMVQLRNEIQVRMVWFCCPCFCLYIQASVSGVTEV